jgi:predicted RNA-binding protein with PUA-like domain
MACWLMKSEPDVFSIDDLAAAPGQTTSWDGVRNYQARNFMRSMKLGDQVFFYHSNADPSAIAGIAEVVGLAHPDVTALDPTDSHYDPKATPDNPIWEMVDIRLVEKFPSPLSLDELRAVPELEGMELLRRGSRLSVQPVTPAQWKVIVRLARGKKAGSPRQKR